MAKNPLKALLDHGQSVWLDYIRRDMLEDGTLEAMIEGDGLMGMTTNPSIFAKAVAEGDLYDASIKKAMASTSDPLALFEAIAVEDVQRAADIFRPVFDETKGRDGYVSIEVSPTLAYDAEGTIVEAKRLWAACDRPNIMVKIPGTEPGLKAIEACLYEGININVTLLFGVDRYRATMEAFLSALERRQKEGKSIDHIASVASFFISRVDSHIDPLLEAKGQNPEAKTLQNRVAIANARVAYAAFEETFRSPRFEALAKDGAMFQRPLWASTSTKNKALSDVLYVDTLIGPDTVNTLPPATYKAFADHGDPKVRLRDGVSAAKKVSERLAGVGIDLDAATVALEKEGVEKFAMAFEELLGTVKGKAEKLA